MALETLKDVGATPFVGVDHEANTITFKIQDGPIKEHGLNGCQLDEMVRQAVTIIRGLNKKFPCRENSLAITKFEEGLLWLDARTKDRKFRGVEGKSEQ